KRGTLQLLDEKLKTIAMARLNNPEATLAELAEEVGLSKSGARHRLNKLMEILQETKE
ncbi:MAG: helix-turn-helix domain-containing protein, partial [Clostridia bacterium]